jgi:hypothetical protein
MKSELKNGFFFHTKEVLKPTPTFFEPGYRPFKMNKRQRYTSKENYCGIENTSAMEKQDLLESDDYYSRIKSSTLDDEHIFDIGSLDVGFENKYNEPKEEMMPKPAFNVKIFIKSSVNSNNNSNDKRKASEFTSKLDFKDSMLTSIDSSILVNLQSMNEVSVDSFYSQLLKLRLDDFAYYYYNHNKVDLNKTLPLRFLNENAYIKYFEPLLLEEVKVALGVDIICNKDKSLYFPFSIVRQHNHNNNRHSNNNGTSRQRLGGLETSSTVGLCIASTCVNVLPRSSSLNIHNNNNNYNNMDSCTSSLPLNLIEIIVNLYTDNQYNQLHEKLKQTNRSINNNNNISVGYRGNNNNSNNNMQKDDLVLILKSPSSTLLAAIKGRYVSTL